MVNYYLKYLKYKKKYLYLKKIYGGHNNKCYNESVINLENNWTLKYCGNDKKAFKDFFKEKSNNKKKLKEIQLDDDNIHIIDNNFMEILNKFLDTYISKYDIYIKNIFKIKGEINFYNPKKNRPSRLQFNENLGGLNINKYVYNKTKTEIINREKNLNYLNFRKNKLVKIKEEISSITKQDLLNYNITSKKELKELYHSINDHYNILLFVLELKNKDGSLFKKKIILDYSDKMFIKNNSELDNILNKNLNDSNYSTILNEYQKLKKENNFTEISNINILNIMINFVVYFRTYIFDTLKYKEFLYRGVKISEKLKSFENLEIIYKSGLEKIDGLGKNIFQTFEWIKQRNKIKKEVKDYLQNHKIDFYNYELFNYILKYLDNNLFKKELYNYINYKNNTLEYNVIDNFFNKANIKKSLNKMDNNEFIIPKNTGKKIYFDLILTELIK